MTSSERPRHFNQGTLEPTRVEHADWQDVWLSSAPVVLGLISDCVLFLGPVGTFVYLADALTKARDPRPSGAQPQRSRISQSAARIPKQPFTENEIVFAIFLAKKATSSQSALHFSSRHAAILLRTILAAQKAGARRSYGGTHTSEKCGARCFLLWATSELSSDRGSRWHNLFPTILLIANKHLVNGWFWLTNTAYHPTLLRKPVIG